MIIWLPARDIIYHRQTEKNDFKVNGGGGNFKGSKSLKKLSLILKKHIHKNNFWFILNLPARSFTAKSVSYLSPDHIKLHPQWTESQSLLNR